MNKYELDHAEIATILAALRHWQESGFGKSPEARPDHLHDIATDCGEVVSMNDGDIDGLCVYLNTGDRDAEPPPSTQGDEPKTLDEWRKEYPNASTYDDLMDRVENIHEAANAPMRCFYSAFKSLQHSWEDESGRVMPWIVLDNLDEVAVRGTIVIERGTFQSPPLTDPTWGTLCLVASASVIFTGDSHHIYFEDIYQDGQGRWRLGMGS